MNILVFEHIDETILVGRDKKNVHENLQDLAELGLVEFEDGPYGSKQPIAVYDTLQVQIPIRA